MRKVYGQSCVIVWVLMFGCRWIEVSPTSLRHWPLRAGPCFLHVCDAIEVLDSRGLPTAIRLD